MSNTVFPNILRFILLVAIQVLVLDHANFLGYINPLIYLLFFLLYPVTNNRFLFLVVAFCMGLIVDAFNDTGGAHAAACVTLAFCRPLLLRLVYGESYEMRNLKIINSDLDRVFLFALLSVLVHHLVLFFLIIYDLGHILFTLQLVLSNGLATLVICGLVLLTLRPKRKI